MIVFTEKKKQKSVDWCQTCLKMYLYEVRAVQLIVDKMQGLYSSGTDMLSVAQRDVVIHPVEHLKISPSPLVVVLTKRVRACPAVCDSSCPSNSRVATSPRRAARRRRYWRGTGTPAPWSCADRTHSRRRCLPRSDALDLINEMHIFVYIYVFWCVKHNKVVTRKRRKFSTDEKFMVLKHRRLIDLHLK